MFLNGFHSPVAGSSEARGCISFAGLAEKHTVTATCLRGQGQGRGRQRHHLISLFLVTLFSHSAPTLPPQHNFLAGGEVAPQQDQGQPNLEA